jgi:hypothetical protein
VNSTTTPTITFVHAGHELPDDDPTASMLGDWFATVLFWRPQVALLVNATTLLPVFMPLAPAATVLERFPGVLAAVLRAHGIAEHVIDREVAETTEQRLAKTNSRSVVGVMNEFARFADWRRDQITGRDDLTWLSLKLAQTPCSPLYGRTSAPTANSQPTTPALELASVGVSRSRMPRRHRDTTTSRTTPGCGSS